MGISGKSIATYDLFCMCVVVHCLGLTSDSHSFYDPLKLPSKVEH